MASNNGIIKNYENANNMLNLAFEKQDKELLAKKDEEMVKLFKNDKDAIEKINKLSMKEVYRCLKGSGFNGSMKDLSDYLHNFGIRKKQNIAWLKSEENFKKCEKKDNKGKVCDGNVVAIYRFFINEIGKRNLEVADNNFIDTINKRPDKNKILYHIKKIIKDCGLDGVHICSKCSQAYKIKKGKSKNVYVKDDAISEILNSKWQIIGIEIENYFQQIGYKKRVSEAQKQQMQQQQMQASQTINKPVQQPVQQQG